MNSGWNQMENIIKEIRHDKCSICGDKHCCRGLCKDIVDLLCEHKEKKGLYGK